MKKYVSSSKRLDVWYWHNLIVKISQFFILNQHPCQVEQEEQYGWACFSGPLSVTVQTDRGGYCPGEDIAVSAFINNQSSSRICGVEIIFFQISVYTIKSGKCKIFKTVKWYSVALEK